MSTNLMSPSSGVGIRERSRILKILESNWQTEMRGHNTYASLAEHESDPSRRAAFRSLAYAENHHADLWAARIRALGGAEPKYEGPRAGDADSIANRVGGVGVALQRLEIDESHDIAKYARQIKELGDEPSIKILEQVLEDERDHYRTLNGLIRNRRPMPQASPEQAKESLEELLVTRREGRMESTMDLERSSGSFRVFLELLWATANS